MQKEYVHAICKTTDKAALHQKRMVIVFRHGALKAVARDSGVLVKNLAPPDRTIKYCFGDMSDELERGNLYKRTYLVGARAHCFDRKGVSGNAQQGCDALIVRNSNPENKEFDSFRRLMYYTPSTKSGALPLERSWKLRKPVRVFRSSANKNSLFAPTTNGQATMYRYDGLYYVERCSLRKGKGSQLFYLKKEKHERKPRNRTKHWANTQFLSTRKYRKTLAFMKKSMSKVRRSLQKRESVS